MQKQEQPVTWFTQPAKSFASFYYYLPSSKILVRIRLELGRTDGSGDTKAIYEENISIGFGAEREADNKNLQTSPQKDLFEYDWVGTDWNGRHEGNKVTIAPVLPKNVSVGLLYNLALKCISERNDIILTDRNASEQDLTKAIIAAAK